MRGTAITSPDGAYRYLMTHDWRLDDEMPRPVVWVLLSPSDSTDKLVRFSKRWGYTELSLVNLLASRSTWIDPNFVANRNLLHIAQECLNQDVILGWGEKGTEVLGVGHYVASILEVAKSVRCFGLTRNGQPLHPISMAIDAPTYDYRMLIDLESDAP